MTTLTTSTLQSVVAEILPTVLDTTSILSIAGATDVNYGTDKLTSYTMGGPSAIKEGNNKPASDVQSATYTPVKFVLAQIFKVSEQLLATDDGEKIVQELLGQAVSSLVKGFDSLVLTGRSPSTGNYAAGLGNGLTEVATQNLTETSTPTAQEIKNTLAATPSANALILSNSGISAVQYSETSTGMRQYPNAAQNSTFDFWGHKAYHSSVVGIDSWTGNNVSTNKTVAYAGDFSNIMRSYGTPTVKFFDQYLGEDLGSKNLVAWRIEVPVSYAIKNETSFTVLKSV